MLSIIITAVLLIVGIGLFIIDQHTYCGEAAGFAGGLFFVVGTFFLGIIICASIGCRSRWDTVKYDYTFTKELIENYERGDYGNTGALAEKVLEINTTIAKHKSRYNNVWFDVWYSEEIGNLEPLMLPQRNNQAIH